LREFQRTGEELHPRVYTSVVLAFAWIVGIAWLEFGFERSTEAAWIATVAVVIAIVFLNIPFILRHANGTRPRGHKQDMEDFLWSNFETATGSLRGWEAYVQIMTIPLSLAIAATLLGLIWTLVGGSA
jgi:hypothetical protein